MVDPAEFVDDLVQVETILWNRIDRHLREERDVGLGAVSVLTVIHATKRCRVQDITATTDMTTGGVSQALDRLGAKGWTVRVPNPDDRRSSLVDLTPEGTRVLTAARRSMRDLLQDVLGDAMSAEELTAYAARTRALRRALDPR
jgi:DNA-binding MarR family transcriptional regulator